MSELRERQAPIKERYRSDPAAARIKLSARGSHGADAVACSVDLGRMVQEAERAERGEPERAGAGVTDGSPRAPGSPEVPVAGDGDRRSAEPEDGQPDVPEERPPEVVAAGPTAEEAKRERRRAQKARRRQQRRRRKHGRQR